MVNFGITSHPRSSYTLVQNHDENPTKIQQQAFILSFYNIASILWEAYRVILGPKVAHNFQRQVKNISTIHLGEKDKKNPFYSMFMTRGTLLPIHLDKSDNEYIIIGWFCFGHYIGGGEFAISSLFYRFVKSHTNITFIKSFDVYHGTLPFTINDGLENFTICVAFANTASHVQ